MTAYTFRADLLQRPKSLSLGQEDGNPYIGEEGVKPSIPVSNARVREMVETNPRSQGHSLGHEIVDPRTCFQHKLKLRTLFWDPRCQIAPDHPRPGVPEGHPSAKRQKVVFHHQRAAQSDRHLVYASLRDARAAGGGAARILGG